MKRLYTLFAILITLCSFLPAAEAQNAEAQNVNFPDRRLAASVRVALGIAGNAPIPKVDLATLTELDARGWQGIADLTGLEHATALTSLNLGPTHGNFSWNLEQHHVTDITPLSGLTQLTALYLDYNFITDISSLSGLTALEVLDLGSNGIRDLSALSELTALTALDLSNNQSPDDGWGISDISVLSNLTALEYLDLQVNQITDITPLAGLTQLETLSFHNNPGLSDIRALSGLTALKHLSLSNTLISDIIPLANLTALKELYLNSCSISDISPLSGLTALEHLHLRSNSITDLSPLSNLTALELLDLRRNAITDVTPLQALTALRVLCLYGTPELTDFQPLHTLRSTVETQGITVLDGAADVSGAPEAVQKIIRRIRDGGMTIYMVEPVAGYLLIDVDIAFAGAQLLGGIRSLDEHTGPINALAWSPDGTLLASGADDTDIHIWNTTTGNRVRTLTGHQSPVTALAFSPDGQTLVSGDRDTKTMRFWNPNTGQLLHTWEQFVHAVEDIAWNPDGTRIATAGNLTVRLWNANAHARPDIFRQPTATVTAVAWSPKTGGPVVGGERDTKRLRFWDPATGQLLQTWDPFVHAVEALAFNPDGSVLASAGDRTVRLWTPLAHARPTIFPKTHTDTVTCLAWHPDGALLVSGSADTTVLLWGTAGNVRDRMLKHTGAVNAVAFSPSGDTVASAGADGRVVLWPNPIVGAAPALSQPFARLEWIETSALAPAETGLFANYPNPFNPETWIPYQLAKPAAVNLSIYAADGRLVRTLQLGHQPAGTYLSRSRAAYWDGRNTQGEPVASGVYFYTLKAGDFTATRKMLILK